MIWPVADPVVQHVVTESRTTSVEAVVFRCGCGAPENHNGQGETCQCGQPTPHAATGPEHVCPRPRQVVDLGTVDQNSTDPEVQRAWEETGKPAADARIAVANEGVSR